jgi:inorganic pyrophosphatase
MGLDLVPAGRDIPNDVNVVIEISMNANPIKYEVDKKSGALFIDRFMSTAMHYPCNYGYIPHTLSGDGDPVDVLVLSPFPLPPGSVVRCRMIGMLRMTDEAGPDEKLLAVPVDKLTPIYRNVQSPATCPHSQLTRSPTSSSITKTLSPANLLKFLAGQKQQRPVRPLSTAFPAITTQGKAGLLIDRQTVFGANTSSRWNLIPSAREL